ncbi:hypothetical protein [Glutamicibacter arilaitensis]|uniref:hypothetical protein n=1 Tax=Glutamicibacter arilaitensis TaxID=256701 RepID=UPI003FD4FC9A
MKTKLAALAVIASLALAGCSAGNQSADATPSPTAASSATAEASATPSVSVNSVALSAADIAKKKQEAIDSGRPENAWDKNCIAWEWPEPDSEGQEWANELGMEWLELRNVGCPDAIVYPLYDVTSFEAGGNGKLIVNYSGNPKWDGDGEYAADAIMEDLAYLGIAPKSVVVRYEANGLEVSNTK